MTDRPNPPLPPEYPEWLERLKAEIRHAQGCAALAVNTEMIRLYWRLGWEILAKQATQKWGSGSSTILRTISGESFRR